MKEEIKLKEPESYTLIANGKKYVERERLLKELEIELEELKSNKPKDKFYRGYDTGIIHSIEVIQSKLKEE